MYYVNNRRSSLFLLALQTILTQYKPYKRFRYCSNYVNLKNDLNKFGLPQCLIILILNLFCTEVSANIDCFLNRSNLSTKLICHKCYNTCIIKRDFYKITEIYNFFYYNFWQTEINLKCLACNSNLLNIINIRLYEEFKPLTYYSSSTDDFYLFAEYWQNRIMNLNGKLCLQCFKSTHSFNKQFRNSVVGFTFSRFKLKHLNQIYYCYVCLKLLLKGCRIKYLNEDKTFFNNNELISLLIS